MDNNSSVSNRSKIDNSTQEHFKKIQLVPLCIIMIVGILANTMVIVNGIRRRRTIRHYSNYFVLSIAFADFGVVTMQVPIAIFEYTLGLPNMSQFTCKYVITTRETFQGAAIFSVSLLALIRTRQVIDPHNVNRRRICAILVAGVWLMSYFICTLPLYFVYKVSPNGYCDPDWSDKTFMRVYITLIFCIILSTMFITTICYVCVIIKIRKTFRSLPNEDLRRRNRNVTVLLFFLIISCWISYVPTAVYLMLEIYTDVDFYGMYGWSITSILYVGGSALNPVLIIKTMPGYRCDNSCTRETRVGVDVLPRPDTALHCRADNIKEDVISCKEKSNIQAPFPLLPVQ